jgi:pimeloyl-ACP methyl ester carboxylesterase
VDSGARWTVVKVADEAHRSVAFPVVPRSAPVDGFSLAYARHGAGTPVVLLHGWPGSRRDYSGLIARLEREAHLVVPDLRGFGGSDRHADRPAAGYGAPDQAASVRELIVELGLDRPIFVGYDIGSRVAQAIAREAPEEVRGLVLSPPLPGIGDRILSPDAVREFWYQTFHQLPLAGELVGPEPAAVRAYLRHFWSHWSAQGWELPTEELDRLVEVYAMPGAFAASIAWYRAGGGAVAQSLDETPPAPEDRIVPPTRVLWGREDPLFPLEWADRIGEFFADATLEPLAGVGHFTPIEAPDAVAAAVRSMLARR